MTAAANFSFDSAHNNPQTSSQHPIQWHWPTHVSRFSGPIFTLFSVITPNRPVAILGEKADRSKERTSPILYFSNEGSGPSTDNTNCNPPACDPTGRNRQDFQPPPAAGPGPQQSVTDRSGTDNFMTIKSVTGWTVPQELQPQRIKIRDADSVDSTLQLPDHRRQ